MKISYFFKKHFYFGFSSTNFGQIALGGTFSTNNYNIDINSIIAGNAMLCFC